ncbi:cytochrome c peroxidase [Geoalkalibacter ferrihydriticus]|uniref:Cytochrome C peroxidase n=2 Tax=Geoalkalibacter ferrihydriticus TaxID=392333 RepID=A0A0C2HS55_9BACT|nr:cytochrome-c peroxidase [Geoalkalibacter ferrihydriticus]KIH77635.1 cytochrome C peroxidase [Geoalkalibacter ferrihydriticus DSM 17813]SDL71285.1 cytochrome c peroxidase [Geoalkalibacter ferrihydriticus]
MIRLLLSAMMLVLLSLGFAWADDDLMRRAKAQFQPIPDTPPVLEGNPATPERVELGRMLYFDPRLSKSQLISCQTCHNVGLAGADLQEVSTGHGWQKGPRNSPTTFNAVFNVAQFWDGRAQDLAEQAKGPVQASVEMNNTPERVMETLGSMPGYVDAFKAAFPDDKESLSFDNMAKAIEVFEATLITPNAPFDQFLKGDANALSAVEKDGLRAFMGKGCASCHNGVNMGGLGYFPFGVVERPGVDILPEEDLGRYQVTNTAADKYVFRSPPLRNVAITQPYFHSGRVWSLRDAVAIMGSAQLGIQLSPEEADQITTFLATLTGEQPEVLHPVLPPTTEKTPKPSLD